MAPKLYPPSASPTPSSQPSATVAAGETGQKLAGAMRKKTTQKMNKKGETGTETSREKNASSACGSPVEMKQEPV